MLKDTIMPIAKTGFAPTSAAAARSKSHQAACTGAIVLASTLNWFAASAAPASATTLSRSVDVNGTPASVWSMIGPFCAIKDWLPPVGTCTETSGNPHTRTLVTKDGKAVFVEIQTARNDAAHSYSYTFQSSPLPVTHYAATLQVTAKGNGTSTVTWVGSYTPDPGQEETAKTALSGIYEAGLQTIKTRMAM